MAGRLGQSDNHEAAAEPTARGWSDLTPESLAALLLLNDIPFLRPPGRSDPAHGLVTAGSVSSGFGQEAGEPRATYTPTSR